MNKQHYNDLICKFDGWKFIKLCGINGEEKIPLWQKFDKDGECIHPGIFHQPDYSKNWVSLMNIVEKIASEDKVSVNIDTWAGVEMYDCSRNFVGEPIVTVDKEDADGNKLSLIETIFKCVGDYIAFVNAQLSEYKVEK